MNTSKSFLLILIVLILLFLGCSQPTEVVSPPIIEKTDVAIANPAEVYCEKQGYKVEVRTAADGSQSGACVFPDGTECDEWAFFRGECKPGAATPGVENKAVEVAKIFLASQLGIDASQVTVFSLEGITWPDACLGIPAQGEVCATVETPGFRVILTVGENHYTYHTDLTGENIRQETAGTQGG